MWIFTKYGFFSICRNLHRQGRQGVVAVRARVHQHLANLINEHADIIGARPIVTTPKADYPHRILITKRQWGKLAGRLAAEAADCENVKDAVAAYEGSNHGPHSGYHSVMCSVWARTRHLTPDGEDTAGRPYDNWDDDGGWFGARGDGN